ncbi:MAG: hypothetical protein EBS23_00725 [Betaproteobacteria bacterium]|nr:hypothetical protein [Betaproteobacteria bacterium]
MVVLVSDTSVLIDLERGNLLETTFDLPFEFVVPDLLYRRELQAYNGPHLLSLGLRVETLSETEVSTATVALRAEPRLSTPDAFSFALARSRNWLLLTGDGPLRSLAGQHGLRHHGVLWMLDQIEGHALLGADALHASLSRLIAHPRCRLPAIEVKERLRRWQS